ncbi:MAG: Uncharacterized protein CEO21_398 [Microgenomates group bacterium Gr01-1014_80]|nr:MAG: Uncharacterized protein CEO21_398 [Microgenomates group bacterium Gr01-1014_80]
MAVQGGLLASTIAVARSHNIFPVLSFLTTKIIAYTILGFILGTFGSALALSDSVRIVMQLLAGLYMIAIALNLLNVHPIFRYAVIQPPRFMMRRVKDITRSREVFAPGLLGALSVFIPCGITLAMEALAISSGNPVLGASIMAAFTLGTAPLFLGLGVLTGVLGNAFKSNFLKLAGILVLYLGITSFNGVLNLAGSPLTLQTLAAASPVQVEFNFGEPMQSVVRLENGVQVADISVLPTSYTPGYIQVQSKVPVKLNLQTLGKLGCTSEFRVPALGISKRLPPSGVESVEFTPEKPGRLAFTCSMGMYGGVIEVI